MFVSVRYSDALRYSDVMRDDYYGGVYAPLEVNYKSGNKRVRSTRLIAWAFGRRVFPWASTVAWSAATALLLYAQMDLAHVFRRILAGFALGVIAAATVRFVGYLRFRRMTRGVRRVELSAELLRYIHARCERHGIHNMDDEKYDNIIAENVVAFMVLDEDICAETKLPPAPRRALEAKANEAIDRWSRRISIQNELLAEKAEREKQETEEESKRQRKLGASIAEREMAYRQARVVALYGGDELEMEAAALPSATEEESSADSPLVFFSSDDKRITIARIEAYLEEKRSEYPPRHWPFPL